MTTCLEHAYYNPAEPSKHLEEVKASKGDVINYKGQIYVVDKVFHQDEKACYRLEFYQVYPLILITQFITNDDFCNVELILEDSKRSEPILYSDSYLKAIGKQK